MRSLVSSRLKVAAWSTLVMLAVLFASHAADGARRGRKKKNSPQEPDVLRYMPDRCQTFGRIDVAKLRTDPAWQPLFRHGAPFQTLNKIFRFHCAQAIQIERITLGARKRLDNRDDGDFRPPFVAVLDLVEPVTDAMVAEHLEQESHSWQEELVAGERLHISSDSVAFCLPDKRRMIIGSSDLVRQVIGREGPAHLPEKLAKARERMDPKQPFALASAVADETDSSDAFWLLPKDVLAKMESVVFHVGADGGLSVRISVACADDATAYELKGIFGAVSRYVETASGYTDGSLSESVEFLASLKTTVDGGCFELSGTVPASSVQPITMVGLGAVWDSMLQSPTKPLQILVPFQTRPVCATPWGPMSLPCPLGPATPHQEPAQGHEIRVTDLPPGFATVYPLPAAPATPRPAAATPPVTLDNRAAPPVCVPTTPVLPHAPPACEPQTAPLSPPPIVIPADPVDPVTQRQIELQREGEMRREIQKLAVRCAALDDRLKQAEQDRSKLEDRLDSYQAQLDAYRKLLSVRFQKKATDVQHAAGTAPDIPAGQPDWRPSTGAALDAADLPGTPLDPSEAKSAPPHYPPADSSNPKHSSRRRQPDYPVPYLDKPPPKELIFPNEDVQKMLGEWERFWYLDSPEPMATPVPAPQPEPVQPKDE